MAKRMPAKVARAVLDRAGGVCEANLFPMCSGRAEHIHHRQYRSRGGEHTVENCAVICHVCHEWIHANPKESAALGWSVHACENPAVEPVAYRGRMVLLLGNGGIEIVEEE